MKIFGERLRELRQEKNLSLKAFGKIIGVSDAAVCSWENNTNDVKAEQIVKVAQYFGVSADYLLGIEK